MTTTSNSKPHLLSSATLLILISIHYFPLSSTAQPDSVSFLFHNFTNEAIGYFHDASPSPADGAIKLITVTDNNGKPLQNSVGHAVYLPPVHIWDNKTGELADFRTVFYFAVDRNGSELHGDGFSFFMAPLDYGIPDNSHGGLLGLASPETAFNGSSANRFLAVEFDSFANEWDPHPLSEFPHVGINVNSVVSVGTVGWKSIVEPDGAVVRAVVRYDSATKELLVLVSYPDSAAGGDGDVSLARVVDLRDVVPEWVRVGFAASTGHLVETYDILFWSFVSSLREQRH